MVNSIAKSDVDFLLPFAIWQSFANWLFKPHPMSVGLDQRKPSGKVRYRHSEDAASRIDKYQTGVYKRNFEYKYD